MIELNPVRQRIADLTGRVISLLQLGGGCGISDPDLNEQPADGRPPPDVPFKPELQEDNGSVRP